MERLPQPYPPEEFEAVDVYLNENLLREAQLISYDLQKTMAEVVGESCEFYALFLTSFADLGDEYIELAPKPVLQVVRRGDNYNYVDLYRDYGLYDIHSPVSKQRLYLNHGQYLSMRFLQCMEEERIRKLNKEYPPPQFSQPVNEALKHYRVRYLMEQSGFRFRLVGWNTELPMELPPIVDTRIPDDCDLPEDE